MMIYIEIKNVTSGENNVNVDYSYKTKFQECQEKQINFNNFYTT